MASRLASQLQALANTRQSVAPNSSRQKPSFLFDPHVAGRFDNETIFANAIEALDQLIEIDGRFRAFAPVLFRPGSWQIDIDVLPQDDVSRLCTQIEQLLPLLSCTFLLHPTHNVLEYLVRQYRVQDRCRDALICMALPYFDSPLFHRIVSLVRLTDPWLFLKPSFDQGEGYAKATLVNRACASAVFFQTVLQTASSGADLARTGSSNHAAVTFASSIIMAVIDRKAVGEGHLRALVPFLQRALHRKKTVCVELRAVAQSVAIALRSFLSCPAANALVTSIVAGADPNANVQELERLLESASAMFAGRRPDWPIPDKAFAHLASIRTLPDAMINAKAAPGMAALAEAMITYLIQSGQLPLATRLITTVADTTADSMQRFLDVAMKCAQDVDQFRRGLGLGADDRLRHPDANVRLAAFQALEDRVIRGAITAGAASSAYYDCLDDECEAVVGAVLQSRTTLAVVEAGQLCAAVRRALRRFPAADDLVRRAAAVLCQSDRDEVASLLIDVALAHADVLPSLTSVAAAHRLFRDIDPRSLCRTIANGTSSDTLPFVLDAIKTRPVLLAIVPLLSSEIIAGSLPDFIQMLDVTSAVAEAQIMNQACQAVAKAATTAADQHRLFVLASKCEARDALKVIVNAQGEGAITFLASVWEDSESPVHAIVSALNAIGHCLSDRVNLSDLIAHVMTVIGHDDAVVRKSALDAFAAIQPFGAPRKASRSKTGFAAVDLAPLLERIIASANEIHIDRYWMRQIPLRAEETAALIRSCDILLTVEARVALLSNIQIDGLDVALADRLAKHVNERSCRALLPRIASALNRADSGNFLSTMLEADQPDVVIEVALGLLSPLHYEGVAIESRRALIRRLSELTASELGPMAIDLLSRLKVSGEIACWALLQVDRQAALLEAWSHPEAIVEPAPFVAALFEILNAASGDAALTVVVLKALGSVADLSSYVADGTLNRQRLAERASASRDACALTVSLLSKLVSDGVASASDSMLPVLSEAVRFLSADDTYLTMIVVNALQVFVPVCSDTRGLFQVFLDSWSSLSASAAARLFPCLIPQVNSLGVCVVHLVAQYGAEALAFGHALFCEFPVADQIIGLADMLQSYGSTQSVKRQRHSSEPMPPALSFIAGHLDHAAFVAGLTNSPACNSAFATLYGAVLSEPESIWLEAIIKSIVAVASVPSFVSHLSTLMRSTSKDKQSLRRRALQLLNDKLETLCESGRQADDVAPVMDTLMPHLLSVVIDHDEVDVNRQLSLLVIDALSAICPNDVIAPFIGAVPNVLEIIPSSSSELRSSALLTLGSLVARLGPHALKFLTATMAALLQSVASYQVAALSALCAVISALPKFLAPYMDDLFQAIITPAALQCSVTGQILQRLEVGVPARVLVTAITQFDNVHDRLLQLLNSIVSNRLVAAEVKSHHRVIFQLCLRAFDTGVSSIAEQTVPVFTSLAVRLNEKQLSSLYKSLLEWAGPFSERSQSRHTNLFSILNGLLDCLESLAVPYVHQVIDLLTGALSSQAAALDLSGLAFDILRKTCQHDDGNFVSKPRFDAVLAATIDRIKLSCSNQSPAESKKFETEHLSPFIAEFAGLVDHEMFWKPLSYELLQLTRSSKPSIRHAAFICLHDMMKRVGEPLLVILPEMMPYISEALEDDDADVEVAVRSLLSLLEQISGENMEEYSCAV